MKNPDDLKFRIALSLIPGVGCVHAKNLVSYFGGVEAVFHASEKVLMKVPGIGSITAGNIVNQTVLKQAEEEIDFLQKNRVKALFYLDEDYPSRLKRCVDAPVVLYSRGTVRFNEERVVAVVGTRNATDYGRTFCDGLISAMAESGGYCVVSGLAYGIDVAAHKACLRHGVQTIGVLAHGLEQIYPSLHKSVAIKMEENGGVVSDFCSNTRIVRQNFLRRNRIIAGLADAVIIVESAERGGALVTADIAGSYNCDVFAVPGRSSDPYSRGCNKLIKENKAGLIENLDDLEFFMSWQKGIDKTQNIQKRLFVELTPEEQRLTDILQGKTSYIDEICQEAQLPVGHVSSLLLGLEFKGIVVSLPGKMYRLDT